MQTVSYQGMVDDVVVEGPQGGSGLRLRRGNAGSIGNYAGEVVAVFGYGAAAWVCSLMGVPLLITWQPSRDYMAIQKMIRAQMFPDAMLQAAFLRWLNGIEWTEARQRNNATLRTCDLKGLIRSDPIMQGASNLSGTQLSAQKRSGAAVGPRRFLVLLRVNFIAAT